MVLLFILRGRCDLATFRACSIFGAVCLGGLNERLREEKEVEDLVHDCDIHADVVLKAVPKHIRQIYPGFLCLSKRKIVLLTVSCLKISLKKTNLLLCGVWQKMRGTTWILYLALVVVPISSVQVCEPGSYGAQR